MTEPFYQTVDLDGWSMTISRSDTIDINIDGGPMPLNIYLNADQADELIAALKSASETFK